MLSKEDNERVTRIGSGTQMGALMRRYWTPALLSSEIGDPDSKFLSLAGEHRDSRRSG